MTIRKTDAQDAADEIETAKQATVVHENARRALEDSLAGLRVTQSRLVRVIQDIEGRLGR